MRTWVTLPAAALLLAVTMAPSAIADPDECRDAVDSYQSALGDVGDALQKYGQCLSNSQGHDDCSSQFSRLQSAHGDFTAAVSDYQSDCQ